MSNPTLEAGSQFTEPFNISTQQENWISSNILGYQNPTEYAGSQFTDPFNVLPDTIFTNPTTVYASQFIAASSIGTTTGVGSNPVLGFAAQQRIEEVKLDEIKVQSASDERVALITAQQAEMQSIYAHDMKLSEGTSQWMKNLRASVRPVITYGFFGLLCALDAVLAYKGFESGVSLSHRLHLIVVSSNVISQPPCCSCDGLSPYDVPCLLACLP